MKPLLVLIIAFGLAIAGIRIFTGSFDYQFAARIAISIMLVFTAIAHFAFTKGMEMMLPGILPFKKMIVQLTGILELLAAAGLLIPGFIHVTAWLLIFFFLAIIPANINAAIHHIDYQKGTRNGPGIAYLWFRVPLQIFLIGWVYWGAIIKQ